MTINQKIIPRLDQKLQNYTLYPCHVHLLRSVLSSARKEDWGTRENNDIVYELYTMFSSLSWQLEEMEEIKVEK